MSESFAGQAISKRYEVRDADTGEVVTGAHVLVPEQDPYAQTAMFAYAALCGLDHASMQAVVTYADPQSDHDRPFLAAIAEAVQPPPEDQEGASCESTSAAIFEGHAGIWFGAEGSIEDAYNLWRSLGYEPVSIVMRAAPKNVQEAAERYLTAKGDAQNIKMSVEARRRELAVARGVEVVGAVPDGQGGTTDVVT